MHVLLAIEAKLMLAVLAFSNILIWLDISYAATCRNGAPAHVVHSCYGVLNAKLLVLFHHLSIQVQVFDVKVVETFLAIGVWTA